MRFVAVVMCSRCGRTDEGGVDWSVVGETYRCPSCQVAELTARAEHAESVAAIEFARKMEARGRRDEWVMMFNRLDAAVGQHKQADRFADDNDEALWAARDRILRELGRRD